MLAEIGVQNVDELFAGIPETLRLGDRLLDLPAGISESELVSAMRRMQKRNPEADEMSMFLGAGAYRHFSPALIGNLILRGEFATSYTPYQPEVSQGTLQAIFEFQSLICMLTGMETANASIYDGASSLAEAVLMAHRVTRRKEVLIARAIHPEYRKVVATYTGGSGLELIDVPFEEEGGTDIDFILSKVCENTSSVVLQSPNFFGVVEQYESLKETPTKKEVMLIVNVAEALSLGILKPPGEHGADIVVGEGQSFGLPVSYGGPYVGFFATREKYLRQMPGRVAGETVDQNGNRAFVLTLSTREQHIRREKATSNICTNQGLCALAVTVYLSIMGKEGMRELAILNLRKADHLKNKLAHVSGFKIKFSADTFNEFVLECPGPATEIQQVLKQEHILAGYALEQDYPELKNCLLLCATETNTVEEIDLLTEKLEAI